MASKMRWRYKNTALVLKPWIMHLLINGDLKQKAQKTQVIKMKSVATSPHPDGHLMKWISDGQVYIKAFFTPESLDHLNGDSENDPPPVLDSKMLILIDYIVDFLPSDRLEYCEFSIVVSKLTIMADLTGFDSKHDPVHCMSLADVRKKCSLLWDQWRNKEMDMSLSSLPLTQLLEELGRQSFETGEEKEVERVEVTTLSILPPKEVPQKSRLCCEIDVTECLIFQTDMEHLDAITEWQDGYKPPQSQPSSKHSSEETFSKVFNSKPTLRGEEVQANLCKPSCLADNKRSVGRESEERIGGKSKEDDGKGSEVTKEKVLTTVDAEIQVSQSLMMDLINEMKKDKDDPLMTANLIVSKETSDDINTEKKQEGIAVHVNADNNNSDSIVEISTPDNPEKCLELKMDDEFSPSLLLPLGNLTSTEQNPNKDPVLIEDSFDESMKDSSKTEIPSKINFCQTVETSSKKVEKDQNDNDSPKIIDEIPMEISSHGNELSNHRSDLLNDLKEKNPLHSKGVVATEEQAEENRLFELKYNRISDSFNTPKTLDEKASENFAQNKTRRSLRSTVTRVSESPNVDFRNIGKIYEKLKQKSSRSDEDIKGHGSSKRKAFMSDSEIFAKKRTLENPKKYFLRARPSIGKVPQENNSGEENSFNSVKKCIVSLDNANTGKSKNSVKNQAELFNRSSDNGTLALKKIENKLIETLQGSSKIVEILLPSPKNLFDSATSNICENVNKKNTVCHSSVTEHSKTPDGKDNQLSTPCKMVDQSPDIIISPPLVLSGQSGDLSGNFLNDAQVISSGETLSWSVGQKSGLVHLSSESVHPRETMTTPINSLPSYQPPRPPSPGRTTPESVLVSNQRETFYGLFEPQPLSELGKSLMNLMFPGDLMKKIEASLSRT